MRRIILLTLLALLMTAILALLGAGTAAAHPHEVSNPSHDQVIANGQNHPGFVTDSETGVITMCEGVNEPADSGPAGYGLETAITDPMREPLGKATGATRWRMTHPHLRILTLLSTNGQQGSGAGPR
jgi:hypothetical protein